jgi:hypothetical protein
MWTRTASRVTGTTGEPCSSDAGEEVGRGGDRLGDRERVLEQPVPVGLVVGLGGRGVAEALPVLAAWGEEKVEQLAQLEVLDRVEQGAQVDLEALGRDLGADRQIVHLELSVLSGAHLGHLDLGAPLFRVLEDAGDVDRGARGAERVADLGIVPADRLGGAGRVADGHPQPRLAVLLAPQLTATDRVHATHPLPVLEVAD